MPANSILSAFSLGLQTNASTAATLYHTALATQSGLNPEFDELEPEPEHPGPAARSTARKAATERTGFLVPVNATMNLRPRFLPRLFQAMGCAITTSNDTTHYTHTIKIANDSALPWMTALHKLSGTTDLTRRATKVRGETLTLNWDASSGASTAEFAGVGLDEGNATGSETLTAEVDVKLSAYSGSLTADHGVTPVTTTTRTESMEITQELDREDKVLHTQGRADLPRLSFDVTGTLGGIDIDQGTYEWYKRIVRGGTSGTNPVLTPAVGELTWTYASLSNIAGAAVPYSITVLLPAVEYIITVNNSSGRDLVRADINWRMIDNTTDCLVVTVVNDVPSYAATA